MLDIRGALHVHSSHTPEVLATPQELAAAAASAGLDFVVLTDRNTLGARAAGDEGQYGSVTLIAGYELNPANNHCLILGFDELLPEGAAAAEYLPRIHAQGGLSFAAQPWQDWRTAFSGMEIWSCSPDLGGPDAATLAVWDNLTTRRRVVGIAGCGTCADQPPYEQAFERLTNHLRVPAGWAEANLPTRRELLLRALAAGHVYAVAEHLGPALIEYSCTASRPLSIGDEGALTTDSELSATVPGADRVRLLRAGEVIAAVAGDQLVYRPRHRGAYRLEAHRLTEQGLRPWVLTNPIYLR